RRRRRLVPRPARAVVRRARPPDDIRRVRARRVRLRRRRDRPPLDRLRAARGRRTPRGRPAQRHRREGHRVGQGLQALSVTVGQVGLGYWGKNLVRNFDDLAELTWLCEASEELRAQFAARYPKARVTGDFDEMLADDSLEAVVVATPVPTHYPLTKRALEAGKHVFV